MKDDEWILWSDDEYYIIELDFNDAMIELPFIKEGLIAEQIMGGNK